MNVIEIPVSNKNQQFDIQLGGGRYRIRLVYRQFCGWVADMMDQAGADIFTGVPLVSGTDILEPYRYMGFNGSLIFVCDETAGELSLSEFGRQNRLYFRAG
ncbi:TPA: hypothetical protein R4229_000403 [Morganella morganii]|jgi:hypothetical protein|nr:hypothetical protein [Morganella morganii]